MIVLETGKNEARLLMDNCRRQASLNQEINVSINDSTASCGLLVVLAEVIDHTAKRMANT
jgi:hypothetical protein